MREIWHVNRLQEIIYSMEEAPEGVTKRIGGRNSPTLFNFNIRPGTSVVFSTMEAKVKCYNISLHQSTTS